MFQGSTPRHEAKLRSAVAFPHFNKLTVPRAFLLATVNRCAVETAPLPKLVDPLVIGIGLVGRHSDDRSGAVDKQAAQVLVPAL